jgi:hypothetical protein
MSSPLQSAIAKLANDFANQVLAAVRSASLEEVLGASATVRAGARVPAGKPVAAAAAPKPAAKTKGGRLARRSSEDILAVVQSIVALLKQTPGLRSEQIQKTLGLASNEIPRPIQIGLEKGLLRKQGDRRATKYFAGGKGGAAKPAPAAAPKKAPAKRAPAKKAPAKKAAKKGAKKEG